MLPRSAFFALVALGLGACSAGNAREADEPSDQLEKVERLGVWQPGPEGTQVPLWPDDHELLLPDSGDYPEHTGNGGTLVAGQPWHWASYVTRPTMTIYRPKGNATGTTMVVLPGGGFVAVAMDLEGTEICDWVVQEGMTCVLLKYRVPQEWPKDEESGHRRRPDVLLALQDAQRAMGLLRQRASSYGIDPDKIGVIGFSAGAYLAANMSNEEERSYTPVDDADRQPAVPDFAIIAYTARLWNESNAETDLSLAPWVEISPKAPPTLLIHAMDDPIDNIRHPMAYALALKEAGVPVDMRLYAGGGHAFGLRPTDDPITTEWPDQVMQWLQNIDTL